MVFITTRVNDTPSAEATAPGSPSAPPSAAARASPQPPPAGWTLFMKAFRSAVTIRKAAAGEQSASSLQLDTTLASDSSTSRSGSISRGGGTLKRFLRFLSRMPAVSSSAGNTKRVLERFNSLWLRTRGRNLTMRARLWLLFESPESSRAAYAVYVVLMCTILISVINFCLSTMHSLTIRDEQFQAAEYYCTAVFTLEYLLRLYACPDRKKFFVNFINTIDLISMLPTYIDLILTALVPANSTGSRVLSDIRLLRLVRLLKMAKTYSGIQIFIVAIERSMQAVGMLLFFLSMSVVLFSSALWYCEREYNPGFVSVPVSFWWGIVTMATVGYGDVVPITSWGRWWGGVAIIVALVLMSLPIAVIGHSFVEVLREYTTEREKLLTEAAERAQQEDREEEEEEAGVGPGKAAQDSGSIDVDQLPQRIIKALKNKSRLAKAAMRRGETALQRELAAVVERELARAHDDLLRDVLAPLRAELAALRGELKILRVAGGGSFSSNASFGASNAGAGAPAGARARAGSLPTGPAAAPAADLPGRKPASGGARLAPALEVESAAGEQQHEATMEDSAGTARLQQARFDEKPRASAPPGPGRAVLLPALAHPRDAAPAMANGHAEEEGDHGAEGTTAGTVHLVVTNGEPTPRDQDAPAGGPPLPQTAPPVAAPDGVELRPAPPSMPAPAQRAPLRPSAPGD